MDSQVLLSCSSNGATKRILFLVILQVVASGWKTIKTLSGKQIINKGYLGLKLLPDDFKWAEDDNFYNDLYDSTPNLELLYINGGEPTLIKQHQFT